MQAAGADASSGTDVQATLFHARQPNCLPWLPDETLFSLCSRHHRVSLQGRASSTSEALFGDPRAGRAHDFPDRIGVFVERTDGELGGCEEIVREHTVLPFYLPFRSAAIAARASDAMHGAGIGSLKFHLGLLTSRFRANHPLKACTRCIHEDREKHYVAYWHVAHQYPGVWLCPTHATLLHESTLKATGVGRFLWHLPDEAALSSPVTISDDPGSADRLVRLLGEFAAASIAVARLPAGYHFDPHRLISVHGQQLRERKLMRESGRIDSDAFAWSLSSSLAPLRQVPELSPLAVDARQAPSQARYLCAPDRALSHPLRHIGLAIWLYGTWQRFIDAYSGGPGQRGEAPTRTQTTPRPSLKDERLARFLSHLRDDVLSVTKAAALTGIDTQTGLAWAAQAGIGCLRRPKKLTLGLRRAVCKALRSGQEKQDVAAKYAISVQTVTTTLRTEVGLHAAWKDARFETKRRAARRAWIQAARKNPGAGVKVLRLAAAAAYAWLYRNDRSWLQAQTLSLPIAARGNHAAVDWDSRDTSLARAVEQTCEALLAESPSRRILLWRIYQRIPQLKALLDRLDRLPLTTAAISRGLAFRPTKDAPLL